MIDLAAEVDAYTACALWSSTGDGETFLDSDYDGDDLAPETVETARATVAAFLAANADDCATWAERYGPRQIGHDLWLTRNGHGAGFWDRPGDPAPGERLSSAARALGELHYYVGDDGKVYGE